MLAVLCDAPPDPSQLPVVMPTWVQKKYRGIANAIPPIARTSMSTLKPRFALRENIKQDLNILVLELSALPVASESIEMFGVSSIVAC